MIKDFKRGIKLLKYSFRWKLNMTIAAIFFLLGTVFFFLPDMRHYGPVYWIITGSFTLQQLGNLSVSSMVRSSPRNKAMQTSIAVAMSFLLNLILYAMVVLARILIWRFNGQGQYPFAELVMYGVLIIILMIYYGMIYKMKAFALIVWAFIFAAALVGMQEMTVQVLPEISMGAALGIGLAVILLGACLQYMLARLTYRRPFGSKMLIQQIEKYR